MVGEQHYSDVFQALPIPCLMLLPDAPYFTIINVSDAYLEITKSSREDLVGTGFFEVFPANPYQNNTIWRNVFDEVIQSKKTCKVPPQKYAFPTADVPARLDVMYLEVINTPVLDDQGEIKFIIRSMTDVTDVVHDEKFFEETQRTARIGSWEVNMARQTVTWSEGLRDIYEVEADFNPGFRVLEEFYPDPDARQAFEDAFVKATTDGTLFHLTLPMVSAKGNERWLSIVGKSDLVGGTCIRMYGIAQDITDNKRLTDLDDLEKRVLELSAQPSTTLVAVLSTYIVGIEGLFSGMYCSILGVQNDRLVSWVAPSLPEPFNAVINNIPIVDNLGSCGTAAYRKERIIVSDIATDPKWVDFRDSALDHELRACWSQPITNTQGEVMAVLGIYYKQVRFPNPDELVIVDRMGALLRIIIENRQNANRIREAATMMAQGQELAHFGIWQSNLETNQHTWSPVLCEIYGIDPELYTPSYDNYLALVHPEDRARVEHLVSQIFDNEADTVFEERIVRPDGEVRHLRSWARLIMNSDQKPAKLIGASMDVTEAKRAELKMKQLHAQLEKHLKEVEQSEQKYSDLFHLSPQPMWVYDLETYRFLDVNDAAVTHYGYTREEFLSMTLMDIPPPEGTAQLEAAVERARRNDKLFSKGVFTHRKKNGEVIKVDRQSNIIQFHGRKAELVLLHDMTEKLYHIEAIEAQNKKLQEIAWMQSHMVRAPLARIMGLVDVIQNLPASNIDRNRLLTAINDSATELDGILRDITEKAEQIDLSDK